MKPKRLEERVFSSLSSAQSSTIPGIILNEERKDLHLSTVDTRIPTQIAWLAGNVLEYIWKIFNLSDEPPMTRFVAKQLSCHHHYNLTAARQDFGYSEKISPQEGWNLLIEYYTDWLEKYPELK